MSVYSHLLQPCSSGPHIAPSNRGKPVIRYLFTCWLALTDSPVLIQAYTPNSRKSSWKIPLKRGPPWGILEFYNALVRSIVTTGPGQRGVSVAPSWAPWWLVNTLIGHYKKGALLDRAHKVPGLRTPHTLLIAALQGREEDADHEGQYFARVAGHRLRGRFIHAVQRLLQWWVCKYCNYCNRQVLW